MCVGDGRLQLDIRVGKVRVSYTVILTMLYYEIFRGNSGSYTVANQSF